MMGVSFNKEVDLNDLFSRFRTISEKRDADGWGVAFYGDVSATVFKEPVRAAKSALAGFLITNKSLKSKISASKRSIHTDLSEHHHMI